MGLEYSRPASLLIQTGDVTGYKKHCAAMLARFGATTNTDIAHTAPARRGERRSAAKLQPNELPLLHRMEERAGERRRFGLSRNWIPLSSILSPLRPSRGEEENLRSLHKFSRRVEQASGLPRTAKMPVLRSTESFQILCDLPEIFLL